MVEESIPKTPVSKSHSRKISGIPSRERTKKKKKSSSEKKSSSDQYQCPVCTEVVSKDELRKHVGEHLYYCMEKKEMFTEDGQKWDGKQMPNIEEGNKEEGEQMSSTNLENMTQPVSEDIDCLPNTCNQVSIANDKESVNQSLISCDDALPCKEEIITNYIEPVDQSSISCDNDLPCKEESITIDKEPVGQSSISCDNDLPLKEESITIGDEPVDQSLIPCGNDLPCKPESSIHKETTNRSSNFGEIILVLEVIDNKGEKTIDEPVNFDDSNLACVSNTVTVSCEEESKQVEFEVVEIVDCNQESITINENLSQNDISNSKLDDSNLIHNESMVNIDDFKYTCYLCNIKFTSFKQLKKHKKIKHSVRMRYAQNRTSIGGSRSRNRCKDENRLQCPDCNKKMSAPKVLEHHLETYLHGNKKCMVCDAEFNRVCALRKHLRIVHDQGHYHCSICNMDMANRFSFKKHQLRHKRDEMGIKGPLYSERHLCEYCGKKCHNKIELTFHKFKHMPGSYKCPRCPLTFSDMKEYVKHKIEHRDVEATFICHICGAKYHRHCDLKRHNYVAHVSKIKWKDKFREKGARSDVALPCDMCEKVFFNHHYLAHHRSSHFDIDESNFTCPFCNKVFGEKQKYLFNAHYKIHTGEKDQPVCKECNKVFATHAILKLHESVHTGEKKHECDVCHAKFRLKRSLNNHYRTHTGERPHACKFCPYRAIQKTDLKAHEKRHFKHMQQEQSAAETLTQLMKQDPSE